MHGPRICLQIDIKISMNTICPAKSGKICENDFDGLFKHFGK